MIYHLSEHIVLFKSEHIPLFCFKELFLEVVAQAMNDRFMFERHCFMLQFTAFETDKSVGQCILLFRRDILLIILIKSAKGITARLTTKSNVRFSSSARAWRKVTFFSPMAFATSVATRTFCRYCLRGGILPRETGLLKECQENLLLYPSP